MQSKINFFPVHETNGIGYHTYKNIVYRPHAYIEKPTHLKQAPKSSRRADIVWSPRSCALTPLDYYLWGAVKAKRCAEKPVTIEALKDNIRKASGEIQLNTIDNVLKNWTERVGYCMAGRDI